MNKAARREKREKENINFREKVSSVRTLLLWDKRKVKGRETEREKRKK